MRIMPCAVNTYYSIVEIERAHRPCASYVPAYMHNLAPPVPAAFLKLEVANALSNNTHYT